jgi:hypothetical protein
MRHSRQFDFEEATMAKTTKTTTVEGGKGQKPVTFQKGGLHRSLDVPQGQKIPASKMTAAKRGDYGPKAKKQANMATPALVGWEVER